MEETTIKDVLVAAARITSEANLESDLRQTAFAKAVDLLVGSVVLAKGPTAAQRPAQMGPADSGDSPLAPIALKLGVDLDSVSRVFDLADGALSLIVPNSKLDKRAANATKEIALLVASGRQAAGLDDGGTATEVIRQQCEDYKRLDSSNFATTIKQMNDLLTVRGEGRNRQVRMTRPGWERAAELVKKLAGEAES